jgi:hypothetical protein
VKRLAFTLILPVAVAALTACGALRQAQDDTQSRSGALMGVLPSRATLPASSSGALLYITDARKIRHTANYRGLLKVVTFPQGQPYATIRITGFADGLCTDASGNVWAVAGNGTKWNAYEFAHGGTRPIATIRIPNLNDYASGCAVDPTTGNLAVLTGAYGGYGAAVDIWTGAKPGKPAVYAMNFTPNACAFDGSGNLFIDGYVGSTIFFDFAELATGSNTVTNVTLDKYTDGYPGGVAWDGTYVDVVTTIYHASRPGILQMQISGYRAHVAHVIHPRGLYPLAPIAVAGSIVVGADGLSGQNVALWPYPAGGKPTATLDRLKFNVRALAISP